MIELPRISKIKMLAEPNITNDGVLHQDVNEFSNGEKVIGVIIWILIEVFGNIMLFGIAHFDRFGGDPLKRRITDRVRKLADCNSVYESLNNWRIHYVFLAFFLF